MKTIYQTRDASLFECRAAAVEHETELFESWYEALLSGGPNPPLSTVVRYFDNTPELACEDAYHEAPLHRLKTSLREYWEGTLIAEPAFRDRCGKEFDVRSALLYFPGGMGEPRLVLPCRSDIDIDTGEWELHVKTIPDCHHYVVLGARGKNHHWLLKLEASGDDIQTAF